MRNRPAKIETPEYDVEIVALARVIKAVKDMGEYRSAAILKAAAVFLRIPLDRLQELK